MPDTDDANVPETPTNVNRPRIHREGDLTIEASREFMLKDLARSNLTPKDIRVEALNPQNGKVPRYRILYPEPHIWRDRLDQDDPKYLQSKGPVGLWMYDAASATTIIMFHNGRLIIIEGEKKAAAWRRLTGEECIGAGGVNNTRQSDQEPDQLMPELMLLIKEAIRKGVEIWFIPDSDVETNVNVQKAVRLFAYVVGQLGGKLIVPLLPAEGATRVGLDDWLIAEKFTAKQALQALNKLPRVDVAKLPESAKLLAHRLKLMTTENEAGIVSIKKTSFNSRLLAYDQLKDRAHEDEFLGEVIDGRRYHDKDDTDLRTRVEHLTGMTWPKQDFTDARRAWMYEHRGNMLGDWLRAQVWDGVPRLDRFCRDYLMATEQSEAYLADVGRAFITGMVKRAIEPGVKFDAMLLLVGRQGIGKTMAIETLAGKLGEQPLHSPLRLDAKSNEALRVRVDHWVVNFDEMAGHSRREDADLKNTLSETHEVGDKKYVEALVRRPRHCVFAGSSNSDTPLRDSSGNRRYWVVRCGDRIKVKEIARDRAQLFAEVLANPVKGHWYEVRDAELEQEAARDKDPWEDMIRTHLSNPDDLLTVAVNGRAYLATTIHGILETLNETPGERDLQRVHTRIGTIMAQVFKLKATRVRRSAITSPAAHLRHFFRTVKTNDDTVGHTYVPEFSRVYFVPKGVGADVPA